MTYNVFDETLNPTKSTQSTILRLIDTIHTPSADGT